MNYVHLWSIFSIKLDYICDLKKQFANILVARVYVWLTDDGVVFINDWLSPDSK